MSERIGYRVSDGVGLLRMDDGKANAMQLAWCAELADALDEAERDESRVLVITGREGFFSAGLDLKVLPDLEPEELRRTTDRFVASMRRVFLFPKPVIAASSGHAIAGGMMLYLAADIRLAARDSRSRYGLNEATTGIPLVGGTLGICQYGVPPAHHTELILHGRMLDVEGTLARGISHEIVAAPQLVARALERARELFDLVLPVYRVNKLLLRRAAFERAVELAAAFSSELPSVNPFASIRR